MLLNKRRRFAGLLAFALVGASLAGCTNAEGDKPSVVLIVTDDQRWDTLWAMPAVRRHLAGRGVTFTNAFVSNSLCCPSRATLLTGNYSHTTRVWHNVPPIGGFQRFRDRSTLATWLDRAGYHTGLFGKYLNGYPGRYIPPGWDKWVAFARSDDRLDLYHNYVLNIDGRFERFGSRPAAYSTNVLGAEAVRYILGTEGPLFVYFAPYAPHRPMIPAAEDRHRFSELPPHRPPSYDERDVSDKPKWIRRVPRLSETEKIHLDRARRRAGASLLSVDRAVEAILQALEATGRLENSLIIFTSDNGTLWGEHRYVQKANPYEESTRVPFILRYDPVVDRPRTEERLVGNIDVAPTIAEVTGARKPKVDGRSLVPLLRDPATEWRRDFLLEHAHLPGFPPSSCGLRSERYSYVRYNTGEEELYDLRRDPYQLTNLARDPRRRQSLGTFRSRLAELCDPPPSIEVKPP